MRAPGPGWEVGASIYAWDMHDEGIEAILDNLQGMSYVNSVYLIGLMHHERHPWPRGAKFPHNPARAEYTTEDAACYWKADPANYGRIKPNRVKADWLRDTDWLETLTTAARKRGMATGLEISHSVIDRASVRALYPDVRQVDIWGNHLSETHVEDIDAVCLNHPDVGEYVCNLYAEAIGRYDIDYLLNCLMPFPMPPKYLLVEYEHEFSPLAWARKAVTLSGCFCPSCHAAAGRLGFDLAAIQAALLPLANAVAHPTPEQAREEERLYASNVTEAALLAETPALLDWIRFKCASITAFYERINARAHEVRPSFDNRLNLYVTSHPEWAGLDLPALREHFDSMRVCVYAENVGSESRMDGKRRVLNSARRAFGPDKHMNTAIGVLPGSTPESVRAGIRVAAETGMDGISLGHYDGATFEMLRAAGEALREMGVTGR
jgi:hypothetical protein